MTKIFVFSDIHGKNKRLSDLLPVIKECDLVYFLGDGLGGVLDNEQLFNGKLVYVHGNCDLGSDEKVLQVEDVKIFITHGHKYSVKFSLMRLGLRAKELGADLVLYGHTHRARVDEYNGTTIVNPGALGDSLASASYSVITINCGAIDVKTKLYKDSI